MASIFTRIIDGELPGVFVWKDDLAVGFLSINPLNPGHTLVVPRQEIDHWLDLDTETMSHLSTVAQSIGKAIQRGFQPVRVGLVIAGFEVPHTHIHVVPINSEPELNFSNAPAMAEAEALERSAEVIRAALRELGYDQVSS